MQYKIYIIVSHYYHDLFAYLSYNVKQTVFKAKNLTRL